MGINSYKHAALTFLLTISLTSCGSGAEPPTAVTTTVTATATVTATPVEASSPSEAEPTDQDTSSSPSIVDIGTAIVNYGVGLTVDEAKIVKSIPINSTNYDPESEFAVFIDKKPDTDGKYLQVQTTIENTGTASLDLTCSWPIEIIALDSKDRQFDPIEDLYDLKGNPECNSSLQPGFKDKMTYVFLVPMDAEVAGIIFRDTSMDDVDFSIVSFDPDLK